MRRLLANDLGERASIPGQVLPKTQKMVLDSALLNTRHYKVRVKRSNPEKRISHTGIGQNDENFKFISIWLIRMIAIHPYRSGIVQLPSYSFCGNWVLMIVIKLCCNFWCCILVILHRNLCKSSTVLIRKLLLSSRFFLRWGGFSFFLKCCHYF